MKRNTQVARTNKAPLNTPEARQSIRTHFGKYRDRNLLKALADEKKTERGRYAAD